MLYYMLSVQVYDGALLSLYRNYINYLADNYEKIYEKTKEEYSYSLLNYVS